MLSLLGYLLAAFVMTAMISQLFPDGRFPLTTILFVMLASTIGAWLGNQLLSESSIFTGAFVGAAITSALLFFLFHRSGFLAEDPASPHDDETS